MASPHARRIARVLVGRPDIRRLFDESVAMVAATMDAGIVSLMLVDPERGDLFVASSRGLEAQNLPMRRTAVRSGVAGTVAAWAKPVLVNNIETDRRFQRLNHPQYSTKSLLSVPLLVEGEVLGVVNVNNKLSRASFDEHDLAVLVALVERIGSAVERATAYPDSEHAVAEAVEAVRSVARLREHGLLASGDVVRRVRRLARELGMEDADVDQVGWVAAIHDIGMTGFHRRIQAVRGPLGEEERQTLARHPELGVEILRPLEYVGLVREMVLAHHEHWDGSGYPRGLRGEEIALGARVIAVVDAYESMVSGRPWRSARTPEEAVAELRRFAGSQFDPLVVDAFIRVLEREAEAS
jgi:HD-GYP domain-containing protein (c-di-GMP phosphodiesterase class II)